MAEAGTDQEDPETLVTRVEAKEGQEVVQEKAASLTEVGASVTMALNLVREVEGSNRRHSPKFSKSPKD
jgi:hypothetical protein